MIGDAAGRREDAISEYTRWLPLINCENRQGGLLSAKAKGFVTQSIVNPDGVFDLDMCKTDGVSIFSEPPSRYA